MMIERVGERGKQHEYLVKEADFGYVADPQHAPDCELCKKLEDEKVRRDSGQAGQPPAAD